jgi:hypothetical protein
MADDREKRLASFRRGRQQYIDSIRKGAQGNLPDPETADQLEQMTDAQFVVYMHSRDNRTQAIPLVPFIEQTGLKVPDVMNELYRPNTEGESTVSQYLGWALNRPEHAERNADLMERTYATGPNPNTVSRGEGSLRKFAQEGTLGWSDEILAWARTQAAKAGGYTEGMSDEDLYKIFLDRERASEKQFARDEPGLNTTAGFLGGLTTAAAMPTGEGMNVAGRLATGALSGGSMSGLYSAGKEEGDAYDKTIAGLASIAPGAIINAPFMVAGRMVNPTTVVPETQAAAKALRDQFKIKALTAGQRTGDEALRLTEAGAGKTFSDRLKKQQEQYMQALFREAGIDDIYVYDPKTGAILRNKKGEPLKAPANNSSQETLIAAQDKLAKMSNDLESRNKAFLPPIVGDIQAIYQNYLNTPDINPVKRALKEAQDTISQAAATGAGTIDGTEFRQLHSSLMSAASGANPIEAKALRDMAKKLDTSMEAWITANGVKDAKGVPIDLGAFKKTRKNWANFYAIKNAAEADPNATRIGYVDPKVLRKAAIDTSYDALGPRLQPGQTPTTAANRLVSLADKAEEVGLGVAPTPTPARTGVEKASALGRQALLPTLAGIAAGGLTYSAVRDPMLSGAVSLGAGAAGWGAEKAYQAAKSRVAMNPVSQAYLNMPNAVRMFDLPVSALAMAGAPERGEAVTDLFSLKEALDQRYKRTE